MKWDSASAVEIAVESGGGADGVSASPGTSSAAGGRPRRPSRPIHAGACAAARGLTCLVRFRAATEDAHPIGLRRQHQGVGPASWRSSSSTSMPQPDVEEAAAEKVFGRAGDPTRRGQPVRCWPRGDRPPTRTFRPAADHTLQAIAKHLAAADRGRPVAGGGTGEGAGCGTGLRSRRCSCAGSSLAACARLGRTCGARSITILDQRRADRFGRGTNLGNVQSRSARAAVVLPATLG